MSLAMEHRKFKENFLLVPVCVRMCSFNVLNRVNIFSHSPHLYGLSSLCTGMCTLRSVERAKRLPHSVHSNGFSPEKKIQTSKVSALFHFFTKIIAITTTYKSEGKCVGKHG